LKNSSFPEISDELREITCSSERELLDAPLLGIMRVMGAPLQDIEKFALQAERDLPQRKADRLISEKLFGRFDAKYRPKPRNLKMA
jgi:hypothetical protein